METMKPTFVTVDQELLRDALRAIDSGLEHTRAALIEHDATLGRTTRKNRMWAELLEADIRFMEQTMRGLRSALRFELTK